MNPARSRYLWPILIPLLAGCASLTPVAPPAAEPAAEPLPGVALTEDVLYDVLLGEIASHRGQINVTALTLGRVAQQTRDPRLAERAALAAIYAKQYGEALKSAQLWVELRPDDIDAHEALAAVLLELDRAPEARAHFERMLAIESRRQNLGQAYPRIAAVLSRHASRPGVLDTMQFLVARHPRVPAAHFAFAHLAVRAGDLDRAGAAAERALQLRPDWEEAAQFRARIFISQKDMARAQAFYESFLQDNAGATQTRLSYARFLIDQKQWEKALDQFQRIVAASPEDADAIYAVGLLSLQTNRLTEAEKYLKLALKLRPANDQAKLYLGQVAEQLRHYEDAQRWYGDIGPGESYFEAQARLGIMIAKLGDLAAARRHLQGIEPENEAQRVQLALAEEQVLREAKLYREALDTLGRVLTALPDNKDLLYARSLIAEKLNLIDVAERDLRAILKQDAKNANALNALGYMLADRGERLDEAQKLLREAMVLKPDDPFILDSYGWLQYRLGNSAEAIKHLRRALALRSDAEISAHLGEVLWVTGERREAESVWDRALKDTPDNEALLGVIRKFKP
ncbi:MAG: tetratricopeptide repeat protein [Gammaproteobacteria bacterium]|nr:MAG: tetratricopeptide repeat protein [Gammaproteobacteria bacterium]